MEYTKSTVRYYCRDADKWWRREMKKKKRVSKILVA
jgi:hypothetical protein